MSTTSYKLYWVLSDIQVKATLHKIFAHTGLPVVGYNLTCLTCGVVTQQLD